MKSDRDAYGREIYAAYRGEEFIEIVERDDGYIGGMDNRVYFAEFKDWPDYEKKAMDLVRGRVLDIGSGAGRVSLYLQSKKHDVLALDNSPLALKVCRQRGVRNTRLMSITQLGKRARVGVFDTIIMFGNNFGLFGNFNRARWLLRRFHAITSPDARIIAETLDVYDTNQPEHLAYQRFNRRRGRMSGQLRVRVLFHKCRTPWFDYLFVSEQELRQILEDTGWHLTQVIRSKGPIYIAVIGKQ